MMTESESIKDRVNRVLLETEFSDKRGAKLDIDDFLRYAKQYIYVALAYENMNRLLTAFNENGIHFC